MNQLRETLKTAYKDMRKQGMVALLTSEHDCCNSCMGGDIDERMTGDSLGGVWTSRQSWDVGWASIGPDIREVYLNHRANNQQFIESNKDNADRLFGYLAKAMLEKHGLEVEWDGDTSKSLLVKLNEEA